MWLPRSGKGGVPAGCNNATQHTAAQQRSRRTAACACAGPKAESGNLNMQGAPGANAALSGSHSATGVLAWCLAFVCSCVPLVFCFFRLFVLEENLPMPPLPAPQPIPPLAPPPPPPSRPAVDTPPSDQPPHPTWVPEPPVTDPPPGPGETPITDPLPGGPGTPPVVDPPPSYH